MEKYLKILFKGNIWKLKYFTDHIKNSIDLSTLAGGEETLRTYSNFFHSTEQQNTKEKNLLIIIRTSSLEQTAKYNKQCSKSALIWWNDIKAKAAFRKRSYFSLATALRPEIIVSNHCALIPNKTESEMKHRLKVRRIFPITIRKFKRHRQIV